ncbi:hypothetical protein RhiirA1_478222, partial [Rhizophagus irregularis]
VYKNISKNWPFLVKYLPPPSQKTPYNIRNQLQKIINSEHILDLTRRKFLTGTMIQTYLNGKMLSDLHPSLNNQFKIDYFIKKSQRFQYPFGFFDNGQYIVLCATKEQTIALSELTHIEIDMAFKRIYGITNEWKVTAYLPWVQKKRDIGETFNFHHIHGEGLGCIIANQYKGQALGLGQYLNSKYPHLTPIEHLQHIYKLCQVHYKWNIDKNKALSSEIRSAMYIVPNLNTQNEVLKILHKIHDCGEPGITGIPSVFSKMDHVIWSQIPNNTNAGESVHANVNRDGHNLSLLAGIESTDVYEKYNVPDTYRNKSELARSIQSEKRAEKRRKGSRQPSNMAKKRKNNCHNKENITEIIDLDDLDKNQHIEQCQKVNNLEYDLLNI